MARTYKRATVYENSPAQVKNREARNRARALMVREGLASKGDGKQVDHIKPISKGGTTTKSNLRVVSTSANESFKRNSKKQLVSQTSTRERRRGRK